MEDVPTADAVGERRGMRGGSYSRKTLNGHWVQYTFYDAADRLARRVAFPRVPIISDDVIAESDRDEPDLAKGHST